MQEPPSRGQQLLEQMIREQIAMRKAIEKQSTQYEEMCDLLYSIRKHVFAIALVVVIGGLLIGCEVVVYRQQY